MSFRDFWTNENNPSLPKSEYLYNTRHILVLVSVVVACIVLSLIFYKKSDRAKNILFYVLGSILLFFEIASRVVNLIIETDYNFASVFKILVPMHICSVMVWVFIVAVFSHKKTLMEYSVICGLLATAGFLAYPAVGLNKVHMSFTCIYSTFSHALGFVIVILMMVLGKVHFRFKDIWKIYLCFAIMFLWGVILDFAILPGSDYMYLRNDPLELDLNFPYQILYAIVLALYTLIFYVINLLITKAKSSKQSKDDDEKMKKIIDICKNKI